MGLENSSLEKSDGSLIAGAELQEELENARKIKIALGSFPVRHTKFILEQAAICGAFLPGALDSNPLEIAKKLAVRLDICSREFERGWKVDPTPDNSLKLYRTIRGVEEIRVIENTLLKSPEAAKLDEMVRNSLDIYNMPAKIRTKTKETRINSPTELFNAVIADGEKGLTLQRYKGLGEMNPDQLWETTLDPNARTLLRVKIDREEDAKDIFSKLMGDFVEPRRDFIQQNALSVSNLDF